MGNMVMNGYDLIEMILNALEVPNGVHAYLNIEPFRGHDLVINNQGKISLIDSDGDHIDLSKPRVSIKVTETKSG
jgi:hypothetical protein